MTRGPAGRGETLHGLPQAIDQKSMVMLTASCGQDDGIWSERIPKT